MTHEEDSDGLAAEYVLGSLALAERRDVDARRAGDRALNAAIAAWERRLAALGDLVPEEPPPAHLFEGIARRIWGPVALVSSPSPAPGSPRQSGPSQPPRPWRRLAVAAALAAVLALVVAVALQGPHDTPGGAPGGTTLLAELQRSPAGQTADEHADARAPPAFRVAVDTALRSILVTPLDARPVARRSYQLWLMAAQAPLPLGIVAPAAATTLPWPTAHGEGLTADAFRSATLAISLEPEGGSPTGAPSGPVLYEGRLSRGK